MTQLRLSAAPLGQWYRDTVAEEGKRISKAEASPPSPADVTQTLERGLAHLRKVGLLYRVSDDGAWARLLPEGVHPYAPLLRDLATRGIGVIYCPGATGDWAGASAEPDPQVFGFKAILLGTDALFALDPESSALLHELVHVELPKRLGQTPYAGGFASSDTNPADRVPSPSGANGMHDAYLAEEMAAYPAGLAKELEGLASALRTASDDIPARLAAANGHTVHGLVVTLQSIACDKQMLGRLERGTLQELPPATLPNGDQQHHVLVRRDDGRTYLATFQTEPAPLRTGSYASLSKLGETSLITSGRLREHLGWQLRVGSEHLAMLRVVGQAIDRARAHRDPRLIDAAMHVLTLGRASTSAKAVPMTYAEALAAFNGFGRASA